MTIPLTRRCAAFVVATVGAVALADVLLFVDSPGWTRGALLLAAGVLVALRHRAGARIAETAWPAAALLAAAAAQLWDGGWLAAMVGSVAVIGVALTARGGSAADAIAWIDAGARSLGEALARPVADAVVVARWIERHPRAIKAVRALRWVAPLAIGALFLALFAWSNPLVERALSSIGDLVRAHLTAPSPARIALWVIAALAGWALLRLRPRASLRRARAIPGADEASGDAARLGFIVRSLVVCNTVFLAETLLDLRYLWAGSALPEGMTYAGYAHRGAYPLVATALLAAGFVLAWFRPRCPAERSRAARTLVSLWLAQDVLLIASAALRLDRYVDVYGLTDWRLATAAWMALVAVGLVAIAWRILARRGNGWLIDVNAVATAVMFVLWGFVDQDGLIAWHDVRHCHEVGGEAVPIDLDHLAGLDPQAAPALAWLAAHSEDAGVAARAADIARGMRARLGVTLADPRAWTVVRASAARAVESAPAIERRVAIAPPRARR